MNSFANTWQTPFNREWERIRWKIKDEEGRRGKYMLIEGRWNDAQKKEEKWEGSTLKKRKKAKVRKRKKTEEDSANQLKINDCVWISSDFLVFVNGWCEREEKNSGKCSIPKMIAFRFENCNCLLCAHITQLDTKETTELYPFYGFEDDVFSTWQLCNAKCNKNCITFSGSVKMDPASSVFALCICVSVCRKKHICSVTYWVSVALTRLFLLTPTW